MIKLEKTKSGVYTIKYGNKYVHSKYDPERESEQFAQSNKELIEKPLVLLYGLGLGYHVDSIVKRMKSTSKLIVFEWNTDLFEACKEYNINVLKFNNVKVITNKNDFYGKLSKYLEEAGDIIIHKPSLETIKESNQVLYNLINDYAFSKQSLEINKEAIEIENKNLKANKELKCKNIKEFMLKFKESSNEKPYVIAASGPSLDYELNRLRENRDKFNIICVGSSLKALMDKKIIPDAIVIVDYSELVRKQFIGYENENIPLCFLATASRWAVENYNGPKYIFNESDEDEISLRTGGTVALPAIDAAVKCEAREIILLGQDLAFIDEKSHVQAFENMYDIEDDLRAKRKNKTVRGVDGNLVNTSQGYIRFKNKIELLISNNEEVKFINCSKGAFINGAKHMDFEEYIKQL